METLVFDSIVDVDKTIWNSIVPNDQYLKRYETLEVIEDSKIDACEYRYVTFHENGNIVGSASFFCTTFYLDILAPAFVKHFSRVIRKFYSGFLAVRLLGCGPILSTCTDGITVINNKYYDKVLPLIEREMGIIAKEKKCSLLLVKEIADDKSDYFDVLKTFGFSKLHSLPNCVLTVRWKSFADYENDLRQKYRKNMRKDLHKLQENDVRVSIVTDYSGVSEQLMTLYLNVYEKSKYKFERITREFFELMGSGRTKGSRLITFDHRQRIVGFVLAVEDESALRPIYIGIDYEENQRLSLYFNMLYHIVGTAIELGKERIYFGQTSYFPKQKVGALANDLYIFVKLRKRFMNWLFRRPLKLLFPKLSIGDLTVFKT